MAESLAHRWGQIIGDGFEMFVRNILGEVALRLGLYLDFKRPRATQDVQGNALRRLCFSGVVYDQALFPPAK